MTILYTHNLKLSLINSLNQQPIENQEELLQEIKAALHNNTYVHFQTFNGYSFHHSVKWTQIRTPNPLPNQLGDLFSRPLYDFDSLLYEHTYKTLELIQQQLHIPAEITIKCSLAKIPDFKRPKTKIENYII